MMSAIQEKVSFDSLSPTHSSPKDDHTSTTPKPDEDDRAKSITSAESDEDTEESDSEDNDDTSIASYDSDFPDQYIIHDHEARSAGKYPVIHYTNGPESMETNKC
jgi:hypothetical protein